MKIMFVGDVHGKFENFTTLCNEVYNKNKYDIIIQLGDFGIWNDVKYDERKKNLNIGINNYYNLILRDLKAPCYFVGGNHENWDALHKLDKLPMKSIVPEADVFYMPFGSKLSIGGPGRNILFMGGADSHDKDWRIQYMAMHYGRKIWWDTEGIKKDLMTEFVGSALDYNDKYEIVVSHERPSRFTKSVFDDEYEPSESAEALDQLLDVSRELGIKSWFHGHWHEHLNINMFDGVEIAGFNMLGIYDDVSYVGNKTMSSLNYDIIMNGTSWALYEI